MDASIRSRSAALTIAVHLVLFLVLLFTAMTIKIPPFPEMGGGGGVLVSIGTVDDAAGDVQPMSANITVEPMPEKVKPAPQTEEKIATQEFEESPIVKKEVKTPKKVAPKKTEPVKTVTPKKTEPVRTADPRAIYQGKTTASKSQGTTSGTGDQGTPTGDPNSRYTGSGGDGPGSGGPGSGGPGIGGNTRGISFSLSGRRMMREPKVSDQSQETGKVVVDITVDKDGNVIAAIPGGRGSTTTSSHLFALAKEASMKAKFNSSADAADIQKGTITYVFVVQ